jgi:hypothetical protein
MWAVRWKAPPCEVPDSANMVGEGKERSSGEAVYFNSSSTLYILFTTPEVLPL